MIRRLFGGGRQQEELRQDVVAAVSPKDTPEEILSKCRMAEAKILSFADILPPSGTILVLRVIDLEREVISLSTHLDGSTRYTMHQILADYLPAMVEAFVRAARSGVRDDDAFDDQAAILVGSMEDILEAVRTDNERGLVGQGIFLENKFGGSDLA